MDLDHAQPIDDFSPRTLLDLCERIRLSDCEEHLIYRESEIDEVWRLVDCALERARREGRSREVGRLEALMTVTWEVHDLLGNNGSVNTAADMLRAAAH